MEMVFNLHHPIFETVQDLFEGHRHDDPKFIELCETIHDWAQINDGAGDDGDVCTTEFTFHVRKSPDQRRIDAAVDAFSTYGCKVNVIVMK